jgi:putative molybdopterin biosynthesis protein
VDTGGRPVPSVAYDRWLDALARAGWSAAPRRGGNREGDAPAADRVPVAEALGRITAAAVEARWPSPRGDCAAMDGIAVRAADLAAAPAVWAAGPGNAPSSSSSGARPANRGRSGGSTTSDGDAGRGAGKAGRSAGGASTAGGASAAGAASAAGSPTERRTVRLTAGMFEWIDTGDPLPAGADTVVVCERLLPQEDGSVLITPALRGVSAADASHGKPTGRPGLRRNVRSLGEDFAAGELLLPAGRRLRPGDLAAAAAGGHASLDVLRRPVVALIPTGDEIRPVGSVLHRGDIMDTNSLMLAARCRQLGALPVVSDIIPDDPDCLAVELRRAAAAADLVLVIAGSSRGRGDHAAAVLAQVGGVAVAGVAVRPGHPALLGHAKPGQREGIAPVIGLPGYPLATAVVFELFAAPLLAAFSGQPAARERVTARLGRDWDSPADVEDWVLVTLGPPAPGDGLPLATPARRGASSISQLARADAWWPVPAGQGSFAGGAPIEVIPIAG